MSLDSKRLIFIDETAAKTNMTRSRGRSPRGERLVAPVPCGHWQTSTLIHAIDHQGTRAALLFEGSTNTEVFETFVEQLLVPELKRNEIIILDNLSSHKGEKVNEIITATGAELRFLPPYSPDLNPIEKIFSKLKSYLRAVGARTQKDLWNTVCNALKTGLSYRQHNKSSSFSCLYKTERTKRKVPDTK